VAALGRDAAGLGWGWLPRSFVAPHVAAGTLAEMPMQNLTNRLELWVDVVWSRERPLGLGARRFIALISPGREAAR